MIIILSINYILNIIYTLYSEILYTSVSNFAGF